MKRPDRAATHPPTPAARITRACKLRQQPVEAPGNVYCPAFIFVAVNYFSQFSNALLFAELHCGLCSVQNRTYCG